MSFYFWKKPFFDEEWADGEEYARPLIRDAALFNIKLNEAAYAAEDDGESFEEFDVPAGYEYRDGWIYVGDSATVARDDYYRNLAEHLKPEFRDLFVERNKIVVPRCPAYIIDGDNTMFFQVVFTYVTRFGRIITIELLEDMYEYLFEKFIETPKIIPRLNDKLVRIYFSRRAEDDNLYKCEAKCREDIAFNLEYVDNFPRNLHSYKRLVMILEAQGRLEEAKVFCERAIELGLTDMTKADYLGRLDKINKKMALERNRILQEMRQGIGA